MGLLIREYVKRDGRGKSRKFQEIATRKLPRLTIREYLIRYTARKNTITSSFTNFNIA